MKPETVQQYFESEPVVEHYAEAAARIGLWRSEEKLFRHLFRAEDSILELGCGAGRIAFGLYELGYHHVLATDYAKAMVERARQMTTILEYRIPMQVADATALKFEDASFDAAIFGFNGLMQIPKAIERQKALGEIYRVLKSGAWFVFTSHDREAARHQQFWSEERERWEQAAQNPELDEFGDRTEQTVLGQHFMHVPTTEELAAMLTGVGFRIEAHALRSALANEPQEVREFSDDCRFWVVQKP